MTAQLGSVHLSRAPFMCSSFFCCNCGLAQTILALCLRVFENGIVIRKVVVAVPEKVLVCVGRFSIYFVSTVLSSPFVIMVSKRVKTQLC